MENKQRIKMNLLIIFLILAIIVIAVMSFFVYGLYNNVKTANSRVDSLNNQISELKDKVNNYSQDNIETDNNQADLNEQQYAQENPKKDDYSIEEITEVLQTYLNLEGAFSGSPLDLLYELGYNSIDITKRAEDNYIKTNIKYNEFKNKMLNYMSEDLFNRFNTFIDIKNCYKNVNGYLYFIDSGATGHGHKVQNVEFKSNNSYVGKVYYIWVTGEKSDEVYDFNFTISSNNGKCIINTIDICNNK